MQVVLDNREFRTTYLHCAKIFIDKLISKNIMDETSVNGGTSVSPQMPTEESSVASQPMSEETPKKKRRSIWIILGIFVVVTMLCAFCTFAMIGVGTKALLESMSEFQDQTFVSMCNEAQDLSETEYDNLFTESYKTRNSYEVAVQDLQTAFPSGFDCTSTNVSGFIEMISKGVSYSIESDPSGSRVVYTYPNDEAYVTLTVEDYSGAWQIESISVTR